MLLVTGCFMSLKQTIWLISLSLFLTGRRVSIGIELRRGNPLRKMFVVVARPGRAGATRGKGSPEAQQMLV